MVHGAVQRSQDALRDATAASAKALAAAERGLDERTSVFLAFCAKYNIDVNDRRDARMQLRFGELDSEADPSPSFLVKTAFEMWRDAKQDVTRFRTARVQWRRPDGDRRVLDACRLIA